jgi:hypothetical protein
MFLRRTVPQRARRSLCTSHNCEAGVFVAKYVLQKVIQQLREDYPASSIDGEADDAGAGAR